MRALLSTLNAAFHREDSKAYQIVQGGIWFLIFLSIAMLVAEPLLPNNAALARVFSLADRMLLAVFAVEYLAFSSINRAP